MTDSENLLKVGNQISHSHDLSIKAARYSFVGSILVLAIKMSAYFLTQSTAILSDASESIINVIAAGVALVVIYYIAQPADEEHPYGHGKMEYFSAAFEGGLIFFAAIAIFGEAIVALVRGQTLQKLETGMALIVGATLINLLIGLYLFRVGKKQKSEALMASGKHVLSDVWSTVGVFVGLGLVLLTGLVWIDGVVAALVAVNLAFEGYKIVRRSIGALIDETDEECLQELRSLFAQHRTQGFIEVHQLKVIRSGRFHHVDAHLVVPQHWDISSAHEWAEKFEHKLVEDYPYDGEFAFHLDPCKQNYCVNCDLENCPIRKHPFEKLKELKVIEMIRPPQSIN